MNLSHRERIERTIEGLPVDRPAVSLWRHFPVDDQTPEGLAKAVLQFQERFDFDFIKITPSSSFCIKDWGVEDEWQGNPEGTRHFTRQPVQDRQGWSKIKTIAPFKGSLGDQLQCIDLVRKGTPTSTPVIQTIFSPLSQAKNLVGKDNLVAHLRLYPEEVKKALQVITNVTIDFVRACIPLKIDGLFFAVQHAQYSLLNRQEFQDFGAYFDLQIIEAAKPLWFNVGHIHGTDIMFDEMLKYPVQVLNWHDLETFPSLDEGKKQYAKGAVCGGLRQWETLAYATPEQVKKEAREAIKQTNGSRFILGTGCVTPIISPDSNIFAAREVVEEFAGSRG
jgi:uroporphyrinogen decarboxylase